MQSIHLQHLFEKLWTDPNLSNNKLFFNPDGTVNKGMLFTYLQKYGITYDDLNAAIDARDTEFLSNASGTALSTLDKTTVGDIVVTWLSDTIYDGALSKPGIGGWAGETLPVLDSYLDPASVVWRPITGDIPPGNTIIEAEIGDVLFIVGICCTCGKLDINVERRNMNIAISTGPWSGPVTPIYNGILTLNPDGSIYKKLEYATDSVYTYAIPTVTFLDGRCMFYDIARLGSAIYTQIPTEPGLYKIPDRLTPDNNTLLANSNIDTQWVWPSSAITIIGQYIYRVVQIDEDGGVHKINVYKYDLINKTQQLLAEDLPISNLQISHRILAAEVLSDSVLVYYNNSDDTIVCYDYVNKTQLWSIPSPKVSGGAEAFRVTGMSYDIVQNYLYVATGDTVVRYTCPSA